MEKSSLMKPKHQRLLLLCIGCALVGSLIFITLKSLSENILFFYTPSDLSHTYIHRETLIRIGGTVAPGSVHREGNDTISFKITDSQGSLLISYTGPLPDLFRENQAIVAEGYLEGNRFFRAQSVLAKHDETYMPKNRANPLEKICSDR